jgi:hypothetical protein
VVRTAPSLDRVWTSGVSSPRTIDARISIFAELSAQRIVARACRPCARPGRPRPGVFTFRRSRGGPRCRSGFQPDPAVFTLSGPIRFPTGPTQSGAPRRERSRGRPLRRSLTENRWSSAVTKKSGWKPDLQSRERLVGRDRGGALCAGVSRRIDGRLLLRRSPVGNRTCAVGAFCLFQNCKNSSARPGRPCHNSRNY